VKYAKSTHQHLTWNPTTDALTIYF